MSAPEEVLGERGDDVKGPSDDERMVSSHEGETLRDPIVTFDFDTGIFVDMPPEAPLANLASFPIESNWVWLWAMLLLCSKGWRRTRGAAPGVRAGSASAWERR